MGGEIIVTIGKKLYVHVGSSADVGLHTYEIPSLRTKKVSHIPKIIKGKDNGNGATNHEELIPMGDNRIDEHHDHMNNF